MKRQYGVGRCDLDAVIDLLDVAFASICRLRLAYCHNDDIWDLRFHWAARRAQAVARLRSGRYALSPVQVVGTRNGHRVTVWSALDAVVLKALSLALTPVVQRRVDRRCHHVRGHGGLKGAINHCHQAIPGHVFVLKSDVADFYASMDHEVLMSACRTLICDKSLLDLIAQYMTRLEITNGRYHALDRGIIKGCPLSPLMGAIVLSALDRAMPKACAYIRYMDDWVILTKTRGMLRRVIKIMHKVMRQLKFKLAPSKTFIGRIAHGFDFLGYRMNDQGVINLSQQTIKRHAEKLLMLYEHCASNQRVQQYKMHWQRWVKAGLNKKIEMRFSGQAAAELSLSNGVYGFK